MYINTKKKFYNRSNSLTKFLDSENDGVFYVGHASILVRLSKKKYLFDVIEQGNFYNDSWKFFPSQVMDERFFDVDGAFVSHVHQDHYDPVYLRKLQKRKIPIYILNGRPNFNKLLKKENITVKHVPYKKKFYINKDIWVYGCLHEYNDIDSSLIISNNNLSVYHGNDNFITEKSLKPFKKKVGKVDIGCIPFAYINYYPYLLNGISKKEKLSEGKRLENLFMDYGIKQAKILKPKIIIPFGSNLFQADNPDSLMNKAVATPVDFVEYAKKKDKKFSNNYKTMLSDSFCLKEGNQITTFFENIRAKKFNLELKKFINNGKKNKNGANKKNQYIKISEKHLNFIRKKISKNHNKLDHKIVISSNKFKNKKILINLFNNDVSIYEKKELPNQCHYFTVEINEFNDWLKGKITFEEILGTRRFRYFRKPNIYRVEINQIYTNYL